VKRGGPEVVGDSSKGGETTVYVRGIYEPKRDVPFNVDLTS